MIVVDASVLLDALLDDGPSGSAARAVLEADPAWAAPACLPIEVLSVTRRRLLRGQVTPKRAGDAVEVLAALEIDWIDPGAITSRIWELRDNVAAFDAAYMAGAEALGVELVTGDLRLAAAAGVRCRVCVVPEPPGAG